MTCLIFYVFATTLKSEQNIFWFVDLYFVDQQKPSRIEYLDHQEIHDRWESPFGGARGFQKSLTVPSLHYQKKRQRTMSPRNLPLLPQKSFRGASKRSRVVDFWSESCSFAWLWRTFQIEVDPFHKGNVSRNCGCGALQKNLMLLLPHLKWAGEIPFGYGITFHPLKGVDRVVFCRFLANLCGDFNFFLNLIHTHLSYEKNPPTFHYTGSLIGILIIVYYNPYITG